MEPIVIKQGLSSCQCPWCWPEDGEGDTGKGKRLEACSLWGRLGQLPVLCGTTGKLMGQELGKTLPHVT